MTGLEEAVRKVERRLSVFKSQSPFFIVATNLLRLGFVAFQQGLLEEGHCTKGNSCRD